jgi:PHD/YefM family antitoxin component YafN of YafNO toxin-antitoxin module
VKTISATDAKQPFAAVIDAAQREPVRIRRQNRDVAIIMSPESTIGFAARTSTNWTVFVSA